MKVLIVGSTESLEARTEVIIINANFIPCISNEINKEVNLFNPDPFIIKRFPKIEEPFIDPKEPIFNFRKHKQTCDKNRKKRKKKRK